LWASEGRENSWRNFRGPLIGGWLSALALGCGGGSSPDNHGPAIATAIATGHFHTCAVVSGGVQCWGSNLAGALGINSTTP
jgi:hypothetical protein